MRWVRQDAVRRGYVSKEERGEWTLSNKVSQTPTGSTGWCGCGPDLVAEFQAKGLPAALDTLRITNGLLFPFRHLPYLLAPDA